MWWASGVVVDGDHDEPHLKRVADVEVGPRRDDDGELRSRFRERIRAGRRKP